MDRFNSSKIKQSDLLDWMDEHKKKSRKNYHKLTSRKKALRSKASRSKAHKSKAHHKGKASRKKAQKQSEITQYEQDALQEQLLKLSEALQHKNLLSSEDSSSSENVSEDYAYNYIPTPEYIASVEYEDGIDTEEVCNTFNSPLLDLDSISASDEPIDILEIEDKYLDEIPGVIKYEGTVLPVVKFISVGGFGKVFSYSSIDNKYSVAVKTYNDKNDPEIKIIQDISKILDCDTINAKIIKMYNTKTNKNTNVAVMDLMDGTLQDFHKLNLSTDIILKIIYKLTESLECLNKKGLTYTDLKPNNVLYKCFKNNKLKVALGDLGSICKKGKEGSSTYPPPEYTYPQMDKNCEESTMVWGLGIILLDLLGINTQIFEWQNTRPTYVGSFGDRVKIDPRFKSKHVFNASIHKYVLNILPTINDPIILELLKEIFLKPKRITLQGILDILK